MISSFSKSNDNFRDREYELRRFSHLINVELGLKPKDPEREAEIVSDSLGYEEFDLQKAFYFWLIEATKDQEFYLIGTKFWVIWSDYTCKRSSQIPYTNFHNSLFQTPSFQDR